MFKLSLVVVLALAAHVSEAALTADQRMLYIEKGALESVVFSEQQRLAPERMLIAVNELTDIYAKLPLPEQPESGERAMREVIAVLRSISRLQEDTCQSLEEFNKDVDMLVERLAYLKDVCNFARAYQAKQNQMCQT